MLTLALVATLAAADPPQDIAGWGTVTDPDGDCTVKLVGGDLSVTVPATPHNMNPRLGRLNGVRVTRSVGGDFTARVKVSGKFQPGPNKTSPAGTVPFLGAGLLVWADKDHFVRLERCAWVLPDGRRLGYPPLLELYSGDEFVAFSRPPVPAAEFLGGGDVWLRLDRAGDTFTARVGTDGKEWTTAGEFVAELPKAVRVGVAAVNTSDAVFPATFGGFKVVTDD